jgi:transcriptional regulator with XRE-family HTH domain
MFDKFRIRQMAMRKGLGLTLKELAVRAKTSYKTAVSWESEESPRRKDPDILLNICDVFQEELGKKFPEYKFKKTEVKKYLEEGRGDLGPAGQLLFEKPLSYGNQPEDSHYSKSDKENSGSVNTSHEGRTTNAQLMDGIGMYIQGDIVQDIMQDGTELQKDRLKKAGRVFLRTALDISEEMDTKAETFKKK